MTNTRTFNDNSHSFKRRKRRITDDGHSRLVSIGSTCSSLYCSCCSALCSEYCRSTTSPWASRLIFSQRAPFRWVFLESMLGGVWGVLREKIASSKLMGLYGAPRDVAPLFSISSLPSLESRIRSMIRSERVLFKAPTMNECEEARGLRSFAFQKDSNYSKNLLERSV